jgi:GxxExxY protein
MSYLHENLTEKIIKAFYNIYNELGYGFLENVYENSLIVELEAMGLAVENQKEISVMYKNNQVGFYKADIIVEDKVIIEVKAISKLAKVHEVQLINYLKATVVKVGLLVNFGKKLEFKRKVFQKHLRT